MVALLKPKSSSIFVRRVQNDAELEAAQHLRYKVFFEEFGATPLNEESANTNRDIDPYDAYADHLIVIHRDNKTEKDEIIGTYRLMRAVEIEKRGGKFTSAGWYDLAPLLDTGQSLLELSRSCVLPEFRTRNILKTLWQGIADYITENDIEIMFGCASFHTVKPSDIAQELSYLHHYHLAPDVIRCTAFPDLYTEMDLTPKSDINVRKAFHALPPLIKGYLRVGASIGHGAVIDPQFSTIDTLIIMQTHMLTDRYKKHYDVGNKEKQSQDDDSSAHIAADILAQNSENL